MANDSSGTAFRIGRDVGPGRRLRRDDGYTIALTMFLLIPLTVVTAFATDVGQWYAQATRMQRAADAAAMAGVVWMDDPLNPNHWSQTALDVASRNGWTNGASMNGGTVSVVASKAQSNQVRVCITAPALLFFGKTVMQSQGLTRCGTAAFNISVPLGSPRNYLGTGDFGTGSASSVYAPENLWLAVSGYCTDRIQGDRVASYYWNGQTSSSPTNSCTGLTNPEYSDDQGNYVIYVDVPAGRTYDTDILIWDGNFRTNAACTSPASSSPTAEVCPGGQPSYNKPPNMTTSFRLMQSDSTIFDDTDNPAMTRTSSPTACSSTGPASATGFKAFGPTTASSSESNTTFVTPSTFQDRGGWWNLCRIPSSAPFGRYILQIRNQSTASGSGGSIEKTQGSNGFSIVANRANASGLCDSRNDSMCPRVYAKDFLSVYARNVSSTSEFFLAEVGGSHAGKTAQIELWDFAENAQSLQILKPTNAAGTSCGTTSNPSYTYANQSFSWSINGGSTWTHNATQINPSSAFNGKLITIKFDLPTNWNPPTCNQWFKVRASFSASDNGQDRTTWSLQILGDPVRLVQ